MRLELGYRRENKGASRGVFVGECRWCCVDRFRYRGIVSSRRILDGFGSLRDDESLLLECGDSGIRSRRKLKDRKSDPRHRIVRNSRQHLKQNFRQVQTTHHPWACRKVSTNRFYSIYPHASVVFQTYVSEQDPR